METVLEENKKQKKTLLPYPRYKKVIDCSLVAYVAWFNSEKVSKEKEVYSKRKRSNLWRKRICYSVWVGYWYEIADEKSGLHVTSTLIKILVLHWLKYIINHTVIKRCTHVLVDLTLIQGISCLEYFANFID